MQFKCLALPFVGRSMPLFIEQRFNKLMRQYLEIHSIRLGSFFLAFSGQDCVVLWHVNLEFNLDTGGVVQYVKFQTSTRPSLRNYNILKWSVRRTFEAIGHWWWSLQKVKNNWGIGWFHERRHLSNCIRHLVIDFFSSSCFFVFSIVALKKKKITLRSPWDFSVAPVNLSYP